MKETFIPRKGQLVWVCSRASVLDPSKRQLATVVKVYPSGCVSVRLAADGKQHDTTPDEWVDKLSREERETALVTWPISNNQLPG